MPLSAASPSHQPATHCTPDDADLSSRPYNYGMFVQPKINNVRFVFPGREKWNHNVDVDSKTVKEVMLFQGKFLDRELIFWRQTKTAKTISAEIKVFYVGVVGGWECENVDARVSQKIFDELEEGILVHQFEAKDHAAWSEILFSAWSLTDEPNVAESMMDRWKAATKACRDYVSL